MKYNTLAIAITQKCTASCSMCCFECSPEKNIQLNDDLIMNLVDQSAEIPQLRTIAISGGEALIRYDIVKEIIKKSRQINKSVTLITNGFWARNLKETTNILKELKSLGLNNLGLSYDDFHAEYINHENIKNIINECFNIGLSCELGVAITKRTHKIEYFLKKFDSELFGVKLTQYPCIPVGNAENICEEDFFCKFSKYGLKCSRDGILAILFDGNVYPCCSQVIASTRLSLGNVYTNSLKEILNNEKRNIALYIIRKYGFDWLVSVIENDLNIKLPDKVIHSCHLCKIIFGNKDLVNALSPFMLDFIEKKYNEKRIGND